MFDVNNPTKLIGRLDKPFLQPTDDFEKSGQYPAGTVFVEGLVYYQNKWYLYYGCADSFVAVAVSDKQLNFKVIMRIEIMMQLARNLKWITTTALSLALVGTACSGPTRTIEEVHFSDYVNPFIGASTNTEAAGAYHGLGKTFPGATTPFGMVQVSPNTITGGDNGSGYSYEHETIEGFAFTQMSGIGWYGDLGNLLVMPTVGDLRTNSGKRGRSRVSFPV